METILKLPIDLDKELNKDKAPSSTVTPLPKTMPVKEREKIRKHLQKLNKKKMSVQEREGEISHVRNVWNEVKNDYEPKEQENLRKVFNEAYPDLKL